MTFLTEHYITCALVSPGRWLWVCALSWTLSAELLEGGAEEGRGPPPAGAAGVGRGGLAAMAGLGGRGPIGRSGRAGLGWMRGSSRMGSNALIGCLGSAGYRVWKHKWITGKYCGYLRLESPNQWLQIEQMFRLHRSRDPPVFCCHRPRDIRKVVQCKMI